MHRWLGGDFETCHSVCELGALIFVCVVSQPHPPPSAHIIHPDLISNALDRAPTHGEREGEEGGVGGDRNRHGKLKGKNSKSGVINIVALTSPRS